jgi:hypothetical protein
MVYLHYTFKTRREGPCKMQCMIYFLPIIHDKQTIRSLKQQMPGVNKGLTRF